MKKILILGLLIVSHLWGLKKWSGGITNAYYDCDAEWCKSGTPKLPDDYKPQKGDEIFEIKVGSTQGTILRIPNKGLFIKNSEEVSYRYSAIGFGGNPKSVFFIDYPNYKVMVAWGNWEYEEEKGSSVGFCQIFEVNGKLVTFDLDRDFSMFCTEGKDFPCPFTKEYILDWIKKQGGQKYFDEACPAYYDELNSVCSDGVLRDPTCQEVRARHPYAGIVCDSGNQTMRRE